MFVSHMRLLAVAFLVTKSGAGNNSNARLQLESLPKTPIIRSVSGCECRNHWASPGQVAMTYPNNCGDPDRMKGYDWCYIKRSTCSHHKAWEKCVHMPVKTVTVNNCTCKKIWSVNEQEMAFPNNCGDPDELMGFDWCEVEGGVCAANNGKIWDECTANPAHPILDKDPFIPQHLDLRPAISPVFYTRDLPQQPASFVSRKCHPHSCGCRFDGAALFRGSDVCEALGACDDSSGLVVCHCSEVFAGRNCERCIDGFVGYPNCLPRSQCGACLNGGICDYTSGKCICGPNLSGKNCESCATGFYGVRCLPHATVPLSQMEATMFAILMLGMLILCVMATARWRIGWCGACLSDTWTVCLFFFEGPDYKTQKILKYEGCKHPHCMMRTAHSHSLRNGRPHIDMGPPKKKKKKKKQPTSST